MTEISRRTFLQRGSIGVAALAALRALAYSVRGASALDGEKPGVPLEGAEANPVGPVVVHMADAARGEVLGGSMWARARLSVATQPASER